MRRSLIEMSGMVIGRLTVIGRATPAPRFDGEAAWHCRCACGNYIDVSGNNLRNRTKSCGCLGREHRRAATVTHGRSGTREWRIWKGITKRCYNANSTAYQDYGGRGITMCDRWRNDFSMFLSDMGQCPTGHSIDRIDGNGPYSPSNCRWASRLVQNNNTRRNHRVTFNGETHTIAEWERLKGMSRDVLKHRLYRGWTEERALTQ